MLFDVFARANGRIDWCFMTEVEATNHSDAIRLAASYLDMSGTVECRSYDTNHSQVESLTRKVVITYE